MSNLQQLEACLQSACSRHGLETRRVYARLRERAGGVRLEVSDGAALAHLVEALHAGGETHVEPVQLPDARLRGRAAWVRASVADVRRSPAHGSEQVTQALQGEVLEPLLHEDGWLLVRLPDGYIGWVRDWHLQLTEASHCHAHAERVNARVALPWLQLHARPGADAPACAETLLGTRVVRLGRADGWEEIELPAGRRGWVPAGGLRDGVDDWPCSAASILEMIGHFAGAPYVWGGRSPKGFDCSGLVQFVFGLHGVTLPRDSDQQFEQGVAVESRQPGDLLFFGSQRIGHVGVALDADAFVHARGEVRHNSLDPESPRYDAELAGLFRGNRRVLPPAP